MDKVLDNPFSTIDVWTPFPSKADKGSACDLPFKLFLAHTFLWTKLHTFCLNFDIQTMRLSFRQPTLEAQRAATSSVLNRKRWLKSLIFIGDAGDRDFFQKILENAINVHIGYEEELRQLLREYSRFNTGIRSAELCRSLFRLWRIPPSSEFSAKHSKQKCE